MANVIGLHLWQVGFEEVGELFITTQKKSLPELLVKVDQIQKNGLECLPDGHHRAVVDTRFYGREVTEVKYYGTIDA